MIDLETVWHLLRVDPLACSILFAIYLRTRNAMKNIAKLDERVTVLETHTGVTNEFSKSH